MRSSILAAAIVALFLATSEAASATSEDHPTKTSNILSPPNVSLNGVIDNRSLRSNDGGDEERAMPPKSLGFKDLNNQPSMKRTFGPPIETKALQRSVFLGSYQLQAPQKKPKKNWLSCAKKPCVAP